MRAISFDDVEDLQVKVEQVTAERDAAMAGMEYWQERAEQAEADARALAIAVRNWSVGDDATMDEVDNALLVALEEHGAKYLGAK